MRPATLRLVMHDVGKPENVSFIERLLALADMTLDCSIGKFAHEG